MHMLAANVLRVAAVFVFTSAGAVACADPPARPVGSTTAGTVSPMFVTPSYRSIIAFLGQSRLARLSGTGAGIKTIADRVASGFDAAPGYLRLRDGRLLVWGTEDGDASEQSMVIVDKKNAIKFAAVVSNVTSAVDWQGSAVHDMAQYDALVRESGMSKIAVFVNNEHDLGTYLPIFYRWQQANMLGFNIDCHSASTHDACDWITRVNIVVAAFVVNPKDAGVESVHVPRVAAANIPLSLFVQ